MKKALEVAVARVVVVGVFDAVDEHAAEAGLVEVADAVGGGGGVLAGAEVVKEGVADGGEDEVTEARHLHEVGSHEPRAEVNHGLEGSGVEHGGGAEEGGGGDGGEELFDVAEAEVVGGRKHGGDRRGSWDAERRRERRGERRVGGVEGLCGGVVAKVP